MLDSLGGASTELHHLGIVEAQRRLARRELSPVDLAAAFLERIERSTRSSTPS